MNLNHQIAQLEVILTDEANTTNLTRRAECNNLLQIVWEAKELLNEGIFREADEILDAVGKRVNELMEDRGSAGKSGELIKQL